MIKKPPLWRFFCCFFVRISKFFVVIYYIIHLQITTYLCNNSECSNCIYYKTKNRQFTEPTAFRSTHWKIDMTNYTNKTGNELQQLDAQMLDIFSTHRELITRLISYSDRTSSGATSKALVNEFIVKARKAGDEMVTNYLAAINILKVRK